MSTNDNKIHENCPKNVFHIKLHQSKKYIIIITRRNKPKTKLVTVGLVNVSHLFQLLNIDFRNTNYITELATITYPPHFDASTNQEKGFGDSLLQSTV